MNQDNQDRRNADEKVKKELAETALRASGSDDADENFSLNDDRRVKVLSPGALVAKRFFRNRLAVTGLSVLIFMFLFSFVGGLITPYAEDQSFYRYEMQQKAYASMKEITEYRDATLDPEKFDTVIKAQL